MGYATPIRNFYTSSGDKLDLKFAKIWPSIIPINSITKSWERLRCFTDTHQNNQTCHCRREDSSYWARRPYNVGTRSGLTSTAERSSYCWLVPCTISNALRWQWIPRIGVFHKDISSLQYFLRSLSIFIHPPRRSYSTRGVGYVHGIYHTVLRASESEVFVVTRPKSLFVACISLNSGFIELVYLGLLSAIYSWGFIRAAGKSYFIVQCTISEISIGIVGYKQFTLRGSPQSTNVSGMDKIHYTQVTFRWGPSRQPIWRRTNCLNCIRRSHSTYKPEYCNIISSGSTS